MIDISIDNLKNITIKKILIIEEARKCYGVDVQPGIQILIASDEQKKVIARRKYFMVEGESYFLMVPYEGENFIMSEKEYIETFVRRIKKKGLKANDKK